MSDYLAGKAVRKITKGIAVERAAALIPQTDTESIFTVVGGKVLLLHIIGEVTVGIGNVANDTRLLFNPDDAAAGNLCADLDIDDDAAGTIYTITGTPANAMQDSVNVPVAQAAEIILKPGAIQLITDANSVVGQVAWTVIYVPIDDGAYVEVA